MTTTTPQTELTTRQRDIYAWIGDYWRRHGYGPTLREGQEAFAFRSPNGFAGHVRALAARGLVTCDRRLARSLRIADGDTNHEGQA